MDAKIYISYFTQISHPTLLLMVEFDLSTAYTLYLSQTLLKIKVCTSVANMYHVTHVFSGSSVAKRQGHHCFIQIKSAYIFFIHEPSIIFVL